MRILFTAAIAAVCLGDARGAEPISAAEAMDRVGEEGTVEFIVRSTGTSRKEGLLFLNSEENFRSNRNFSIVLDPAAIASFKAAGIKDIEKHYFCKKVRVTGRVEHFKSVTDIKATKPEQIQIVDEKPDLGFVRPTAPQSTPDNFDPRPTSYTYPLALGIGVVALGIGVFVGKKLKGGGSTGIE